jgi:formylmethanofuran dehydrogenase subunit E
MLKGIFVLGCTALLWGVWRFDSNWIVSDIELSLGQSRIEHDYFRAMALQPTLPTETPEQWVELGRRVHGGFGSYVALGIQIGLDAMQRLEAAPRTLDVTYYSGAIAPCPCVADGIMIATTSTPGQNLLRVAATPSPEGTFGVAEIRNTRTGKRLRYSIPATAKAQLDVWNRNTTGLQRYDAVMNASEKTLFKVEAID